VNQRTSSRLLPSSKRNHGLKQSRILFLNGYCTDSPELVP
jgi:hypothetical protein